METEATLAPPPRRSPLPLMGVSKRKRAAFYTQLARMLHAGIGPVRALGTLATQGGSWRLSRAAADMAAQCQMGGTLGEAFARHPNLFPPNEMRMIEAAGLSGTAPETLLRLARLLDKLANSASKVIAGLIYPCLCLCVAFGALPLLVAYFVGSAGSATRVLLAQLGVVGVLIGGVLLLVTAFRYLSEQSGARVALHAFVLHVPLFGKLFRRLALARFADTFQCLYAAGVMVPEALARAATACGNAWIGSRILRVAPMVKEGVPLAVALAQSGVVPRIGLNLIEVGEQAGELEATLQKFAEYQHDDLDVGVDRLTKILPTMAIFLMILILAYAVLTAWGAYIGNINKALGP